MIDCINYCDECKDTVLEYKGEQTSTHYYKECPKCGKKFSFYKQALIIPNVDLIENEIMKQYNSNYGVIK